MGRRAAGGGCTVGTVLVLYSLLIIQDNIHAYSHTLSLNVAILSASLLQMGK